VGCSIAVIERQDSEMTWPLSRYFMVILSKLVRKSCFISLLTAADDLEAAFK
jgi:hypothetical protein